MRLLIMSFDEAIQYNLSVLRNLYLAEGVTENDLKDVITKIGKYHGWKSKEGFDHSWYDQPGVLLPLTVLNFDSQAS